MTEPQPPFPTRYQLAWVQLYQLIDILNRSGCPPLAPTDLLDIMATVITAQIVKPDP